MTIRHADNFALAEHIERLVPYSPGRPIEEVKRELGLSDVVKLASNENPLGPSPRAVAAMREHAESMHLYPDGACHALRHALAQRLDIAPDHIVFGNGSDELIHYLGLSLLTSGDEVVQADLTFVRYESAAVLNQAHLRSVPLRDDTHDLAAMADCLSERTRLVFIANPNNPTGTIVTRLEVADLLRRMPDRAVLVLDEAYYEYVSHPDYPDALCHVREGRNIVVLRTFSKAYGLAGLRVGYGIAPPHLVRAIEQVREPFNVSRIGQAAALAALDDHEHLARTRSTNAAGMRMLTDGLRKLNLGVTPSEANFLWIDLRRPAAPIADALLRQGIIVRAFEHPRTANNIRVTIGTEDQNARFLNALTKVLGQ